MSTASRFPDIVVAPSEHVDELVNTVESVVALVPDARFHLMRTGIPALDAPVDLLAAAGPSIVDADTSQGWAAMVGSVDRVFRKQPWCLLMAGEQMDEDMAAVLDAGGQLIPADNFAWLEQGSVFGDPRVRTGGAAVEAEELYVLPRPVLGTPWLPVITATVGVEFSSWAAVYDDVCTLTHAGELDAAYQRAELSWRMAEGDDRLRLVRAAVMLASMNCMMDAPLPAASEWFRLEPHPFVAHEYVRCGLGRVPFDLVQRVLDLVPTSRPVVYGDHAAVLSVEQVMTTRRLVEQGRAATKGMYEVVMRAIHADKAGVGEVAGIFRHASLLGIPPSTIVRVMPDRPEVLATLGDAIDIGLEADFIAQTVKAFVDRFGHAVWVDRLVQRFVMIRHYDALRALDAAGVDDLGQVGLLRSQPWIDEHRFEQQLALVHANGFNDDRLPALGDIGARP